MQLPGLPVTEVLSLLLDALRRSPATILSAPPGAGKTTLVPLAVMESALFPDARIIMLEPRRLAARRAAEYMASLIGEEVGRRVGYRIRGEVRAGRDTRVEVVTEGILTRMLQSAPDLPGVGLIIFDEFHERSIHADLGLALATDVQEHLREDLRILVMSATLDNLSIQRVLPNAMVLTSSARQFPVETVHRTFAPEGPMENLVAETVRRALTETEGDLLVFLPGQREIRRVERLLSPAMLGEGVQVHLLYGEAPVSQQQAALLPARPGERKVILSTNVAETSLTIDGVRVVVDSGMMRVSKFDPRRGMAGLVTVPASRSSADQRRGRAGRQAPGVCYRLWTREQEENLPLHITPEILLADLAPLALELAAWGGQPRFIDPPPGPHLAQAQTLLQRLGALDVTGRITPHGSAMRELPVHPRLAHMILTARELGLGSLSCEVAALLEDADLLRGERDGDFRSRWHVLRSSRGEREERVRREARRLRSLTGIAEATGDEKRLGTLIALAYPDRVGRQRGDGRYLLSGGTGAVLPPGSLLGRERFLAVADLDGAGTEAAIRLASPVEYSELQMVFSSMMTEDRTVAWDGQAVVGRRKLMLGQIILEEEPITVDPGTALEIMLDTVRSLGLACLSWTAESRSIRARSEWLRRSGFAPAGWPDMSEDGLIADLPHWLGPHLRGVTRKNQLERLDTLRMVKEILGQRRVLELDRLAPASLTVPTGSRIRLNYDEEPVLPVKLQEMFGQVTTPAIAGGKVAVLLHLLSPAGRPLAITRDLPTFWNTVYPEVRKEMRGRYPRHPWPEDPLAATPTRRAKKKGG